MYPVDEYSISFSGDYTLLRVLNSESQIVASFDLTEDDPPYSLQVVDDNYVIAGSTCSACWERYAIDVEANAGSASVTGSVLTGLGIIDLRDTGRTGLTVEFYLNCCPVEILRTSGDFGLRFSSPDDDCFDEI